MTNPWIRANRRDMGWAVVSELLLIAAAASASWNHLVLAILALLTVMNAITFTSAHRAIRAEHRREARNSQ